MNENTYHIGSRWIININHHSVHKCGLWQKKRVLHRLSTFILMEGHWICGIRISGCWSDEQPHEYSYMQPFKSQPYFVIVLTLSTHPMCTY